MFTVNKRDFGKLNIYSGQHSKHSRPRRPRLQDKGKPESRNRLLRSIDDDNNETSNELLKKTDSVYFFHFLNFYFDVPSVKKFTHIHSKNITLLLLQSVNYR